MITLCVNRENERDATADTLDNVPMSLGVRIEERRKAIGISQAELARRVGVRQSTMNSLIRGDNRTSRSLLQIARELRTSPAYLTGETNDPAPDGSSGPLLDSEKRELIDRFDALAPIDRRALLQIAKSMAGGGGAPPSETVHAGGGVATAATVHDPAKEFRGEGE